MKLFKRFTMLCLVIAMLVTPILSMNLTAHALNGAGAPSSTNPEMILGIDLSYWNVSQNALNYSQVNFSELKADGCKFVILRLGYETSTTSGIKIDPAFDEFYKRARAAGLDIGLYLYSYALSYSAAQADAKEVMNYIEARGMYFEYPIYLDMETTAQTSASASTMESICLGWCEILESNGYYPAIYSAYWVFNSLSSSFKSKYDFWVPAYKSTTYSDAQYTYTSQPSVLGGAPYKTGYSMWQYSCCNYYNGSYVYDGVYTSSGGRNTSLDLNVCYKDYPTIMKTYGYNNCGTPESASKTKLRNLINSSFDINHNDYSVAGLEAVRWAEYEGTQLLNNDASTDAQFDAAYNKLYNALNAKAVALSKGKSYTATNVNRTDVYADDGIRLTDGLKGFYDGGDLSDGVSKGRYAGWNKETEIVVDLGSVQSSDTYTIYFAAGQWGIILPKKNLFSLQVLVSNSPTSGFTSVGTSNDIVHTGGTNVADDGWSTYTLTVNSSVAKSARYIKFRITNNDCKSSIWMDEVEVSLGGGAISGGAYINGVNEKILSGDCHIFTPAFGTLTVSTANHAYTMNVIADYNSTLGKYVVTKVFEGVGTSTADVVLSSNQIMIAAHCWEGDGITDPVAGSYDNTEIIARAKVGDVIEFSGVNTEYSFLTSGSHVSFHGATEIPSNAIVTHTPSSSATCTDDQICTVCREVITAASGHDDGKWVTLPDGSKELQCTVCGEALDEQGGNVDFIRGDANGDGQIDMFDYLMIKSIYFEKYVPTADQAMRSDANSDGNIDMFDYLIVRTAYFTNK